MLQGESGVLRKEFDKLVDWTKDEPVPDIVNLPNSLLISMAAPLKRALDRPVCVTLQGEELFIDGLVRTVSRAGARADSPAGPRRRSLHRRQRLLRAVHVVVPRNSRRTHLGRAARHQHGRVLAARGARRRRRSLPRRVSGAVAPEKGLRLLAEAYVRLRPRMDGARARLEVAGYLAGRSSPVSRERPRGAGERAGLQDEMAYRGEIDRAGKRAFLRELDVLSVPATYDEPKGHVPARSDGERRTGRAAAARCVHRGRRARPAAACSSSRMIPTRLPAGLHSLWADPAAARAAGPPRVRRRACALHDCALGGSADRGVRVARCWRVDRVASKGVA